MKEYDEGLARDYGSRWTIEEEVREAAAGALSDAPGRILDAGCGNGLLLVRLPPDAFVVGLERSPWMIDEARRRAPRSRFVIGDLARLPFRTNAFTVAAAVNVLWGMKESDARRGVGELARVAGRAVLDYRNRANPGILLRRGRDARNPFHKISVDRFRGWLRAAGLTWTERPIRRPWSRGFLGALLSRVPGWAPHLLAEGRRPLPL